MTEQAASAVLERLCAVEWTGDWDDAFARLMSRRVLMREYLRRAAVWAQRYSAESAWPFFDVTEYAASEFTLSPETSAGLQACLARVTGGESIRRTCTGAVRLAVLRAQDPAFGDGLPDLYEPLVLFYERGGEFLWDNAGSLDLTGALMRPGTLQGHLGSPLLPSLDSRLLDVVDAEGRITYYAAADRKGPVLRQRVVRGEAHAEAFDQEGLRWEPVGRPLPTSPQQAQGFGLVWLDEMEAFALMAAFLAAADGR
ncbi:hypothetical protein [Streptomyces sp. NPDC007369]|uniref:hypothetical protein n=1 Tax=Streptomyces sp. NPDC007369 TaxID=3154589 RepID=UPI0033D08BDB